MKKYTDVKLSDLFGNPDYDSEPTKTSKRKVNVSIDNHKYICTAYKTFSIDIPVIDHNPSLGKRVSEAWNKPGDYDTLTFLFDVVFPDDIIEFMPIDFLALQQDNGKVVLVAKEKDKAIITECLSCSTDQDTPYSRACASFPERIQLELRCLGFGSNYSVAYATSFARITAQFDKQKRDEAKCKDVLSKQIIDAFENGNYLNTASLTNTDKLNEYNRVLSFCANYIPELSEHRFNADTFYDEYHEFIEKSDLDVFFNNWSRLRKSFNALNRGANGEAKVYEVLRLFDDRIRILKDYVWGHEHDFVVITPYGISTIEVKNLRGNYVLTETGILKCLSSNRVKPKDVALQSKKHLETLRRNLSGCSAFFADIPLQEIVCSAEAGFTIQDNYHYLPICYYNTVDKVLLPEGKNEILNSATMDAIESFLLQNQQNAFKFDVFLPRGEIDSRSAFITSFANVAGGYLVAQQHK